jgi:hypothetical protein
LFDLIRPLAEQMEQVAHLMQVGDADRAADAARIAARLARELLSARNDGRGRLQ